jgi:hypothetical protein
MVANIGRYHTVKQERKKKADKKKPKTPKTAGDAFLKTLFAP